MKTPTVDPDILEMLASIEQAVGTYTVVLFNDDNHSMEEVAAQIVKALSCDVERACIIMLQAHFFGKTNVIRGPLELCQNIAHTLGEINLHVELHREGAD